MQVLVTEIYKVKNGIAPEIMKNIFELQNPSYNLRSSCNQFRRENIKIVHCGLQSQKSGSLGQIILSTVIHLQI